MQVWSRVRELRSSELQGTTTPPPKKLQGYTVQHREQGQNSRTPLNGVQSVKLLDHYVIYPKHNVINELYLKKTCFNLKNMKLKKDHQLLIILVKNWYRMKKQLLYRHHCFLSQIPKSEIFDIPCATDDASVKPVSWELLKSASPVPS